ncbi:MAG: AI-2E family transporter [Trueperaceae bacterium]|nr:AI-2E family transporter [Trueperaceae bacterium]
MIAALRAVWANPYVRVLVLVALVVVTFLVVRQTRLVWGSLLVAIVVAYLVSPVVDVAARLGYPRWVGVLTVAGMLLVATAGVGALAILVSVQLADLSTEVPGLLEAVREGPFRLARLVDPSFGPVFEQVFSTTYVLSGRLADDVIPSVQGVGAVGVRRTLGALSDAGTSVALVLVVSLYLMHRFPDYLASTLEAVAPRHRPFVRNMADKADRSIGGFVRGQLALALVVGVLSAVGLSLLGIPLALVLGVLAGIFNLIPFFGPIIVMVPTVIIAATVSWVHVVGAVAILLVVNFVDGNVLMPLVYSRTVALDPITIIVAILFGLSLFGLLGALVAVPLAAFMKVVYVEEIQGRSRRPRDDRPRDDRPRDESEESTA